MRVTLSPLAEREGIRSCAHGNYVIFFTATKARVTVVRVLHGAMDIPAQFGDTAK